LTANVFHILKCCHSIKPRIRAKNMQKQEECPVSLASRYVGEKQ